MKRAITIPAADGGVWQIERIGVRKVRYRHSGSTQWVPLTSGDSMMIEMAFLDD